MYVRREVRLLITKEKAVRSRLVINVPVICANQSALDPAFLQSFSRLCVAVKEQYLETEFAAQILI